MRPPSISLGHIRRALLTLLLARHRPGWRRQAPFRRLRLEPLEDRVTPVREVEPNGTLATATAFTAPDTLEGRIADATDVDYFRTTLAQGASLKLAFADRDADSHPAFGPAIEILNSAGVVVAGSPDSHVFAYTAHAAGPYYVRLTATNAFGTFTDDYAVMASVEAFSGVTETEGNDSPGSANPLGGAADFRGSLSSAADVDYFSFSAATGQAVTVKFAARPGANPTVKLFDPSGALLSTNLTGTGLFAVLSQAGTYAFALGTANAAGTVTGPYVGQLLIAEGPEPEAESADGFDGAPVLNLGPTVVPGVYLSPDGTFTTAGLTGSYVNQTMRWESDKDWRATPGLVAGTRTDPTIHFPQAGWGPRAAVGVTGGTDDDWDNFSVQWDGFVRVVTPGTTLSLASDDGSRMWIDVNHDGSFDDSGPEFVDNGWGFGQDTTLSPPSAALAPGDYRIRIQYEEGGGGNNAYLLWGDAVHSGGVVARNSGRQGVGVLSGLADVDVFAVDLSATGFYEFSLQTAGSALATQGRVLTLYNQFGQPLEYATTGRMATDAGHFQGVRPETNSRYYVAVRATNEAGLGGYALSVKCLREFPQLRDVPLFYQNNSGYDKQELVPELLAFFEARYDVYQIDVTQADPGPGSEHVDWTFKKAAPGSGSGGSSGGSFGERRPTGSGSGQTDADWARLADVWFGLSLHENGHGVGLYHAFHPLHVMGYGSQADFYPIGTHYDQAVSGADGDQRVRTATTQNARNYLDWALEAGRIVPEDEANDTPALAQQLDRYFAAMTADADPRNDQVVVTGAVATPDDVDVYRFSAAADELFAFDIDAAEFQYPLDARLDLLDSSGNLLARSQGGLDRDTGLSSVDPNLTYRFGNAGNYYVRVAGEHATTGAYRLKVTPGRALDADGPRVAAAWPDGGAKVDGTRQLIFWFNDQLDPATLTPANVVVKGRTSGVRTGSAVFDPIDATLTWRADMQLPPDDYTVTLRGTPGGITDLRGNRLDGETGGTLAWPAVSGDGVPGGDFTTAFTVTAADTTPAEVFSPSYERQAHERGMFTLWLTDELDARSVYEAPFTLRGAGPDHALGTGDDTFTLVDVLYDRIRSTGTPGLRVFTRGVPDPDTYRLEASLLDAAGHTVRLAQTFDVPEPDGLFRNLSVVDLNVQPNSVVTDIPTTFDVTFSGAADPATLTTNTFRVRYSPDPIFFDGNDSFLVEADGKIDWDASRRRASFRPAAPLRDGYYLLELKGTEGGIISAGGRLLDGEYLDAAIAGYTPLIGWQDAPSGDGHAGGDYRAYFKLDVPGVTITASGGGTTLTEGGATDSYFVRLDCQPSADVTVTLTPDSQVTASPLTLTFTPFNWNVPQTVTVTAVDDGLVEGDHTGSITHTAASGDARYDGIAIAAVTATIIDNDSSITTGTVNDGPGDDVDFQASATTISANWSGFSASGGIADYRWAIGTAPGAADVRAYSDVGNVTSATSTGLSLSDGGTYYVSVKAEDSFGNLSDPAVSDGVTVDAAPPTSRVAALPAATSTTFTVRWSGEDGPGGSGVATFDVYVSDDGGAFAPLLTNTTATSAVFTGILNHTYGFYSVATDKVGNREPGPGAAQASTTVRNTTPAVHAGPDAAAQEGAAFTRTGSFTDPDADTWTATVDYGDGAGPRPLDLAPDKSFMLAHAYDDNGAYTVAVIVTDSFGASAKATFVVTAANVAPTATFTGPGPITYGQPATVSFSDQSDPSGADLAAGLRYAYAADPADLASVTYANAATQASHDFTGLAAGSHTLYARIIDKDDGFTQYSVDVTVTKAGQSIAFAALPDRSFGDAPFTLSASTSSGLPVSFRVASGPAVVVSGNLVQLLGWGAVAVEASQPGDANHEAAAPVTRTFNVAPPPGVRNSISAAGDLDALPTAAGRLVTNMTSPLRFAAGVTFDNKLKNARGPVFVWFDRTEDGATAAYYARADAITAVKRASSKKTASLIATASLFKVVAGGEPEPVASGVALRLDFVDGRLATPGAADLAGITLGTAADLWLSNNWQPKKKSTAAQFLWSLIPLEVSPERTSATLTASRPAYFVYKTTKAKTSIDLGTATADELKAYLNRIVGKVVDSVVKDGDNWTILLKPKKKLDWVRLLGTAGDDPGVVIG